MNATEFQMKFVLHQRNHFRALPLHAAPVIHYCVGGLETGTQLSSKFVAFTPELRRRVAFTTTIAWKETLLDRVG